MANEVYNRITMDEANIEKFIKLYGEGDGEFSFKLIVPEVDGEVDVKWRNHNWGTKWNATDDGNGIGLREVLSGTTGFSTAWNPPFPVYKKMAAAGLDFEIYWEAENLYGEGIGRGEAKGGKFWALKDLAATSYEISQSWDDEFNPHKNNWTEFVDADDNHCEIDSACVHVYGTVGEKPVFALPVKKLIETGEGDENYMGEIKKFPDYVSYYWEEEGYELEEFNDFLRCHDTTTYLLDKNGNRITALKDFDHTEPDEDGYVYYPVPASDLEDGSGDNPLTPEAVEKWKAKLGL